LTAGNHDFLPPAEGLADTFLVAMAMTREPLLTPNDTTGEALRLRADLTNDEVDTAVICDTVDALQANAIAACLLACFKTKKQCKGCARTREWRWRGGDRSYVLVALVVFASEWAGGERLPSRQAHLPYRYPVRPLVGCPVIQSSGPLATCHLAVGPWGWGFIPHSPG